jgi:general stress protein 26
MSDLKKQIFEAAREIQLMNFATVTEEGKPWVRYVVGKADENLTFRFCTFLGSRKVAQMRNNPNVHISMGVKDEQTAEHWLQVAGTAEIATDQKERHAFWFDQLEHYFSGPDDPSYCVIVIRPSLIEFGTMGSMEPEVWRPE